MDQTENQKQQSLIQFIQSRFHGKLTQLLLSVSVFSLLFSHSYWLSFLHSFSFNFQNTLPFQLFSHSIDKNCIFLVCNGLLVFLAKNSGLISSSKYNLSDDHDQSIKSYQDVPQSESNVLKPKAPLLEKDKTVKSRAVMEETQEEDQETAAAETETQNFCLVDEEEDGEKWGLNRLMTSREEENAAFAGEDEDLNASDDEYFVQDFEEIENSDRHRVISTEELNKRFDEFIRKMKEELRIEARQQLVMV